MESHQKSLIAFLHCGHVAACMLLKIDRAGMMLAKVSTHKLLEKRVMTVFLPHTRFLVKVGEGEGEREVQSSPEMPACQT